MITFHSRQSDCDRHVHKNQIVDKRNFASQFALLICTVAFTKCEKFGATIFTSRCSRTSLVCIFRQGHALLLNFVRFLRLANGSSKNRLSPARRSRNGLEPSHKKSGEMSRPFPPISAHLPGSGKCNAADCPQVNSEDNSQVGAQTARNVRVAIHAIADATSRETSRKMTARNCVITISKLTPNNYELLTINTQP